MVLQVPQKLGLLFRFTQNRPVFVWQVLGAEGSHFTVHCPAASKHTIIGVGLVPRSYITMHRPAP